MDAITNALNQGEPDFTTLTTGITNLDTALKDKLAKIADSVNKAKAKAETANTSLQAKLTKLNADTQAKTQSLEAEITKLKSGSESDKKKVIDKINELSKSVGTMTTSLSNNTGSEQTISALDQIIDKISSQLNSGTPSTPANVNPSRANIQPLPPTKSLEEEGIFRDSPGVPAKNPQSKLNPNAKPFTPGKNSTNSNTIAVKSQPKLNPNAKPFKPQSTKKKQPFRGGYRTNKKRSSMRRKTSLKKSKRSRRSTRRR
jgi:hypothetical protein